MKIIFAGTPNFAASILKNLIANNIEISGCYSQPDKPKGRGRKLLPTPVKQVALENNIPVFQPVNFKSNEALEELKQLKPDLMIVVAYGLILPQKVLDIPKYGCINVHGSILPKWRGAAPVQRAILNGDAETGVSIMQLDAGMDTGDVIEILKFPILDNDTTESVLEKMNYKGTVGLINTIEKIKTNNLETQKQNNDLATHAAKIDKSEAEINWNDSAINISRKIRAFYPAPICFFTKQDEDGNELKIKIIEATINIDANKNSNLKAGGVINIEKNGINIKAKDAAISIKKIQFPGGKAISAADVKNSQKYLQILK